VGVPGDRLVPGRAGLGQAGARVEGPSVADRVFQPVEEPVGQRAGLERPAVLAAVDRPPDPVPGGGAAAELLGVPEPDVITVHLLRAPLRLCLLPGGAATRSARCAGPALRRPATAPPAARPLAGASGRTRPGTPAARRSPPRSSAAGHPGFRVLRPGWRRAGRERCPVLGAARPRVRDDGRSAPPAPSSPAPDRAAMRGGPGRVLARDPVLPEGKADRDGRGVPDGGRRHGPAVAGAEQSGPGAGWRSGLACRPGPQASTLHSGRPVKSFRHAAPGLAPVRAGAYPPGEGDTPRGGPASGPVPRKGPSCEGAWLRAARAATATMCHGWLTPRPTGFRPLQKSGSGGLFSPTTGK
jgi:hypothetical protein